MSISSFTVKGKTKVKAVLLGDQNVGKTSIIERYINDKFEESQNPTIGIDFVVSNVQRSNKNYRLQLWDTAGQQRFKSLIPSYLKDSNCAIILYDVSNQESAENSFRWLEMYNENKDESAFAVFVGNKIDLKARYANQNQMKQKCEKQNLSYLEVSAKSGENVTQLFNNVLDIIEENLHKNILEKDILQSNDCKSKSPPKNTTFTTESQECFTAGVIKLDNISKVVEEAEDKKKKRKCC